MLERQALYVRSALYTPSILRRVSSPYVPRRRFGVAYLNIVQTAVEGFYHGQTLSLMATPRGILTMVTDCSGA